MRNTLSLAGLALVLVATIEPTQAVTHRYETAQGGIVCQLSIPTTDSKARPKASGFRNEGTTNAFTICGIPGVNDAANEGGSVTQFWAIFNSIGGVAATFECTAVNGFTSEVTDTAPAYSTKTVTVQAGGGGAAVFSAGDFGGADGYPLPNNDYWSITCLLPPNVSVAWLSADYNAFNG